MNLGIKLLISILLGYCFGIFKTGYFLGKLYNVDVSSQGSGNTGMTNTMRVMGKKVGLWAFLGDTLKCIIPIIITFFLFGKGTEHETLFLMVTGLGAVLGDMFPFYLNFNGGKGVSSMSGIILSFMFLTFDWKYTVLGLVVFFTTMFVTRYVSVASMTLMTMFLVELIVWGQMNMVYSLSRNKSHDHIWIYLIAFVLVVLVFVRHKANIKRLLNGTENKIGQKKEA